MNANPTIHVTELMSGKGHCELTAVPGVAVGIAVAAVAWFNPSQAAAATVVSPAIAAQPGIGLQVNSRGQPSEQPGLFDPVGGPVGDAQSLQTDAYSDVLRDRATLFMNTSSEPVIDTVSGSPLTNAVADAPARPFLSHRSSRPGQAARGRWG